MINNILVFGDDLGIPQSLKYIPSKLIRGIVVAEIRPRPHKTLQNLAERMCISCLVQPQFNSKSYQDFVEKIRHFNPDLIFVHSYSMLLRPDILTIPKYGAVNIHYALLPKYRGANPVQWAMINGELETGVTMHYMDEGIDSGDIIAQRHVPIYINDTWVDALARINAETDKMLEDEIPRLLAETNARQPQDESHAEKYPRRYPDDGLVDWQQSPYKIYNLVRALVKPLPGAFCYDDYGQRIVLDEYLTLQEVANMKLSFCRKVR